MYFSIISSKDGVCVEDFLLVHRLKNFVKFFDDAVNQNKQEMTAKITTFDADWYVIATFFFPPTITPPRS